MFVLIFSFFGCILTFLLLRHIFHTIRFRHLLNSFRAKWESLSLEDKTTLLYAIRGHQHRRAADRAASSERSKFSAQELDLSQSVDEMHEIEIMCPRFEEMDLGELNQAFFDEILLHWRSMKLSGDFDYMGTKAELETIFENRDQLARRVKST